jgi:hypothetical protein
MIEFKTLTINERSKEVYERELNFYKDNLNLHVLISHIGHFSQDLVNGFSENSEEILLSAGEKKSTIKKVFSILVEGLQNIRFHGEKDPEDKNFGVFILARNDKQLKILFGSLVNHQNSENLSKRLENLNAIADDDVKEHYMQVLNNGIISVEGNAGLGFITMRLKSGTRLAYNFYPVAEELNLFTVEVTFEKNEE